MARGRLSFATFHATFIQPFLTKADFLVNYTAMTHWWMAATTDRAAHGAATAANHSALKLDVSEDGNYAARARLLAWGRRVTEAVLARAPAWAAPDPLTGTQFSTAMNQLSDRLCDEAELARTELVAQRTADREAPNFSDRLGTAAGKALIALLGVPSVDNCTMLNVEYA